MIEDEHIIIIILFYNLSKTLHKRMTQDHKIPVLQLPKNLSQEDDRG
jgi:hypothetical protein